MKAAVASQPLALRLRQTSGVWFAPAAAAIGYYAAAQAAFLIGTFSDRVFAPFWPPNAILFCILLLQPTNRWWTIIAATFPAHVLAELSVAMPPFAMLLAFLTNCALAVANAVALRWFAGGAPWFGSMRKAVVYIFATSVANPAIIALAGAFVPIAAGGSLGDYPYFWATWYVGNALASLTLGPMILSWAGNEAPASIVERPVRLLESVLFGVGLIATCILSLELSVALADSAFRPAVLYLPLPIILWGAVRFGERGASGAILILTVVSISLTLRGESPFVAESAEKSVTALQLFLFGIAVPVLLLSSAVDELRAAGRSMRTLAGALLKAQDDERRRIARDLHDSTAQNLVAAGLLARSLEPELAESARLRLGKIEEMVGQSIGEIRLLSYLLHPPQLEHGGLGPALNAYADGFADRSGIDVRLALSPGIGRLPQPTELVLYRVVQEALTNVDRHSGSRAALIRLERRRIGARSVVRLVVEDFGRGMQPRLFRNPGSQHSASRGLGLDSMRERLEQVGGRLNISSAPGRTIVSAIVPADE